MSIDAEILEEMEKHLANKENLQKERGVDQQPKGMRFKQKTNIEFMGEEVEGRTRAWRTDDGREVWLNTGELQHHLSKRGLNGQRVFTLERPSAADKPPIIEGLECQVCIQFQGYSSPFRSEANYEDHMEILHPREWQRELREREMGQRRRETDALVALAQGKGAVSANQNTNQYVCETCGKATKSAFGLRAHARSHASG